MSSEDENRILKTCIKELEKSLEGYEKRALEQKKAIEAEIGRHEETEAALRISQRQLSQAMELAGIVYWEIDADPEILFCNDAFYSFYGTTAEQEGGYAIPVEQYAKKFVHPDDLQNFFKNKEIMDATLKREFSADMEHRIVRADGDVRHIQARVRVLKDPGGHTTRIYGAHQDITDRKQIEDDLRENAYFLQTLIDAIPSPVYYKDIHGVYQGCNAAYEKIMGKKKQDIIGNILHDFVPREFADKFHAMDMALFRKGGTQVYETSFQPADNTSQVSIIHKAVYEDAKGIPKGYVGVVFDITERKRAEEALCSLNDELERKVEARTQQLVKAQDELVRKEKLSILGQLAGTVGHELRNPMGVMSNAVYFLRTVLADSDDNVTEYLNIIQNEIGNSLQIVTELLDFSRTRPPEKTPIRIDAWVHQSMEKYDIPENVTVKVDIPNGLPVVNVDILQMTQVFLNLITNAVQAMPGGGLLEIIAGLDGRQQTAPGEELQEAVNLRVRDTGMGISPENMEKLFQPLFTTKPKGVGLGLVVCKNLVEANGGEIAVESRPKTGAVFTVTLPVLKEKK